MARHQLSLCEGGVRGNHDATSLCNNNTFLSVFTASCPFVTSVEATQGLSPEKALNLTSGGRSNFFASPSYQLQDFRLVSVPGRERRRRVIGVDQAMLQLLALQHELEELLDLKGDTFDDLVEEDIKVAQVVKRGEPGNVSCHKAEAVESQKDTGTSEAFDIHGIFDPTFRPPTFYRLALRENRRPTIVIEMSPSTEEKQVLGESRGNIRHRKDDGEKLEDIPPAKRQATPCRLRPRGNDSHAEKVALAPAVGKVVTSGRGCLERGLSGGGSDGGGSTVCSDGNRGIDINNILVWSAQVDAIEGGGAMPTFLNA
ncbi:hypothetical protein B0H13DRAFT_1867487 [Mycena leptocephala]|nr:hypothetical protein B0H13DRAFT_1867487 [Mycena leptocephala]